MSRGTSPAGSALLSPVGSNGTSSKASHFCLPRPCPVFSTHSLCFRSCQGRGQVLRDSSLRRMGSLEQSRARVSTCVLPVICKGTARATSIQSRTVSPAQAVSFSCGSRQQEHMEWGTRKENMAIFHSVLPGNSKETVTLILCAVNPH